MLPKRDVSNETPHRKFIIKELKSSHIEWNKCKKAPRFNLTSGKILQELAKKMLQTDKLLEWYSAIHNLDATIAIVWKQRCQFPNQFMKWEFFNFVFCQSRYHTYNDKIIAGEIARIFKEVWESREELKEGRQKAKSDKIKVIFWCKFYIDKQIIKRINRLTILLI